MNKQETKSNRLSKRAIRRLDKKASRKQKEIRKHDKRNGVGKKSSKNKLTHPLKFSWRIGLILLVVALIVIVGGFLLCNYLIQKTVKEEDFWVENVAYSTTCIDDATLEKGTKEVQQEGVNGVRKNYFEITKKLLTGEQTNWRYLRWEDIKQPVNEIARCGTRKWQYMWCSDGGYRYYTDEQFSDPNTGFTHASEDFCAKNGQGAMTQLADTPPAANNNMSHSYEWYVSMYGDPNQPIEYPTYNPSPMPDLVTLHDDYGDNNNNQNTGTDRTTANNICQSEANSAYQSIMRQLGAMGAGSSSASIEAQRVRDNTYNSCMARYGY